MSISTIPRSVVLLAAMLVCAVALALATPGSRGTLIGTINNSTNSAASAVVTTQTCTSAATAAGAYFVYPLADAAPAAGATTQVAADVSGNNRPGQYNVTSGVTFGTAGPCPRDGGKSATFNGSTGYASGPNATLASPQNMSVQIWFRADANLATGGKMIGFGTARTGSSGSYDRHLYMGNDGKITWGVYPNAVKVVTSPLAYNDNRWHLATGTISSTAGATVGQRLYIDGELVASDTTTTTAQVFTGYWRMGWDTLASWTPKPTSDYFKGSLSFASFYTSVLTPTQVRSLYSVGV